MKKKIYDGTMKYESTGVALKSLKKSSQSFITD